MSFYSDKVLNLNYNNINSHEAGFKDKFKKKVIDMAGNKIDKMIQQTIQQHTSEIGSPDDFADRLLSDYEDREICANCKKPIEKATSVPLSSNTHFNAHLQELPELAKLANLQVHHGECSDKTLIGMALACHMARGSSMMGAFQKIKDAEI
jgi:hypothetical protein